MQVLGCNNLRVFNPVPPCFALHTCTGLSGRSSNSHTCTWPSSEPVASRGGRRGPGFGGWGVGFGGLGFGVWFGVWGLVWGLGFGLGFGVKYT